MACFLAPVAEAAVMAVASKVADKNENKEVTISFSRKLGWLKNMLLGGAGLLAFEHVWHGEVTPWAPFLTAMETSEATSEMLSEIATTGVGMAVAVTAVWAGMLVVSRVFEKREAAKAAEEN